MTARRSLLLPALLLLAALLVPASSAGHSGGKPTGTYQWGAANAPRYTAAMKNVPDAQFKKGPCTDYAAGTMPVGKGHDHLDINQHRFACNMQTVAYDSLKKVFGERQDVSLGEMDVKGNLAVIAVAYPESGFLLFDVTNTASPKLLSWYRGDECEGLIVDVDCGAFVDLSPDGKRVYISVQQISVVPGGNPQRPTAAYPGIDVVDISDRKAPTLRQKLAVQSVGGVHTARSFRVPEGPSSDDKPRAPGEYVVGVANSVGAYIAKVEDGMLVPVTTIRMNELHDTFVQQDPLTGRTLMYIASGFDSGFYVYDVTDPSAPKGLAEWDITPECEQDWYAHTMDVTTVNNRRIVTMPVELIDFFGDQSKEDDPDTEANENDQAQGCGKLAGNGDMAGPLFIVDATDFSKLGKIDATDSEDEEEASDMKQRSERALITTWSNAANRAGGELTFSPHNQQIVGDLIYLSGYHSGVTVLDAHEAFEGRNVRPQELGVIVPHGGETRPIHPERGGTTPLFAPFFTSFLHYRPLIWDMQFHKGHVLAGDMVGGFYSIRYTGPARANVLAGESPTAPRVGRKKKRLRLRIATRCSRRKGILVRLYGVRKVRTVRFYRGKRRLGSQQIFKFGLRIGFVKRGTRIRAAVVLRDGRRASVSRRMPRCTRRAR
jgi:hypothetical protein